MHQFLRGSRVGHSSGPRPASRPAKLQPVFAESHAAAIKNTVITAEKTMGVVKAYLTLNAVTATKEMASAHAMLRTRANVSVGSPPSSHANTAANKRNTERKKPNALKKSQYVRLNPCASKCTERINPRTASAPHAGLFWRNPSVCPAAKSSRRTAAIRKNKDAFMSRLQRPPGGTVSPRPYEGQCGNIPDPKSALWRVAAH